MPAPIRSLLSVLLAWVGLAGTAHAHLIAPHKATIHLVGAAAYSVVWLPASVLDGVPRDAAGRVAQPDLDRVAPALTRQLGIRFTLRDGAVEAIPLRTDLILQPPDNSKDGRADQLVMLHHAVFPQPPRHLEVETDLFGPGGDPLTVSVTGGLGAEQAVLWPPRARHLFFAQAAAAAPIAALSFGVAALVATVLAVGWSAHRRRQGKSHE